MKRLSKVLFLLHFPPPVHGSAIMGLSVKNSSFINQAFDCHYVNLLASKNVAESGKINFRKIFGFFSVFIKILITLISNKPDICYLALTSTGRAFYKDLLLIFLLKIFSIKRVYHLHNKGVRQYQNNFFNRFSYRFVFKDAQVILLSKNLYADVHSFVPETNVHICPNGIADEYLDHKDKYLHYKPLYLLPGEEKKLTKSVRILFLSNLSRAKGVYILLEACALLSKKGVPFSCIFIGSEGDISVSEFNDRVNRLGIGEQVGYFGKRYGEEKNRAFAEADIFVFPTYFETFGLVNLEAMQHSLPVVSTLEGGIPDIVDNNVTGFLVSPKSAVALAEKIELLIQNPILRYEMGQAGRKKYESEFTLEKFEQNLTKILFEITESTSK